MIEFNKDDLPDSHERLDQWRLSEEDKSESHTWHIYIRGKQNVRDGSMEVVSEAFNSNIADTVIPEKASVEMLSFYFTGTLKEAIIAAEVLCDKLNQFNGTEKYWDFDSDSIMVADPDPTNTNEGP